MYFLSHAESAEFAEGHIASLVLDITVSVRPMKNSCQFVSIRGKKIIRGKAKKYSWLIHVIRAIRGEFSPFSSLNFQLFYSKIANILIANILIANILIIFADDEGSLIVDIVKH